MKELEALGNPKGSADLELGVGKETGESGNTRKEVLTSEFKHLLPLGTRWQENSGLRSEGRLTQPKDLSRRLLPSNTRP